MFIGTEKGESYSVSLFLVPWNSLDFAPSLAQQEDGAITNLLNLLAEERITRKFFFFPKSCEINSTIQKVVPKWLHLKGNTIGFRPVVKVRGTNYLAISWSRNKAVNLNVASSTVCSLEQNVNVIFSPRISLELVWKWSCAPDRTGIGTVCFWRGENGIPRKNKNFVC